MRSMRWLFLLAAIFSSACAVKKSKTEVVKPIDRDTGILVEEDLEALPES